MSIDLYDEAIRENPYPTYEMLRDSEPVYFDERRNEYFISRYADCARVLVDAQSFSSEPSGFEATMVGADGTIHRSLRGAMMPAFVREHRSEYDRKLRKLVRRTLRKRNVTSLDAVLDLGAAASTALFEGLIDGRGRDQAHANDWTRRIVQTSRRGLNEREVFAPGTADISDAVADMNRRFARSEGYRRKTKLTQLLVEEYVSGKLSMFDLENVALLLVLATTETIMSTTGIASFILATRPDIQAKLRADESLTASFIEEALRYDSPVQRRPRVATRDTEIAGVKIPAGALVTVLLGSANRDPRQFADADEFILGRTQNAHLAFSSGPHLCIGRKVGQTSLRIEMEELIAASSRIDLATEEITMAHPTNWSIRGPRSLPLRIERARRK